MCSMQTYGAVYTLCQKKVALTIRVHESLTDHCRLTVAVLFVAVVRAIVLPIAGPSERDAPRFVRAFKLSRGARHVHVA